MNAVYCVFLGAEGRAGVMDLCGVWLDESPDPWDRCWAGRRRKGGLGFRGTEQERVSDRRGSLADKWRGLAVAGGSHRFCATSTDPHFTLGNGSWHHNYIIIARSQRFIQLWATKWTERGCLNPREGTSPRRVTLINWFADTSGHYLFKIGYRPAWWMWHSLFDDSV